MIRISPETREVLVAFAIGFGILALVMAGPLWLMTRGY